jgi:hypothetical protein
VPEEAFNSRLSEYWYHVSSRDEIPLAGEIIEDDENINRAHRFFLNFDYDECTNYITTQLLDGEITIDDIRPWIGKADKAFYLEMSLRTANHNHPDPDQNCSICGCDSWDITRHQTSFFQNFLHNQRRSVLARRNMAEIITEYFIDNDITSYAPTYAAFSREQLHELYNALIGGANTQKIAKRMGHGAEQQVAILLNELGCTYRPGNKHTNPMSPDENLNPNTLDFVEKSEGTIPADLVILEDDEVRVIILGMIHTSDPGQYGVDKANNARDYFLTIDENHDNVEFWLLVDGVGFSENTRGTITPLLANCTSFVQLESLFKLALRLHELGLCRIVAIRFLDSYDQGDITRIGSMYVPDGVMTVYNQEDIPEGCREIDAGRAVLFISVQ